MTIEPSFRETLFRRNELIHYLVTGRFAGEQSWRFRTRVVVRHIQREEKKLIIYGLDNTGRPVHRPVLYSELIELKVEPWTTELLPDFCPITDSPLNLDAARKMVDEITSV